MQRPTLENILFQPIRINKTFLVVLLIISALGTAAFTMYKAVRRVGQPFQGFFIGANLMVSVGQRASWPGVEGGLKPLDKVLKVNAIPIANADHFRNLIKGFKKDQEVSYTIERAGQKRVITVPIKKISIFDFLISFLAPFSIGLIFITLGAFTLFYVPDQRVSNLYFILCSLIGIFCIVLFESYTSHTFFRFTQIYPIIAAVAVNLFAIFEETGKLKQWRLFTIVSVYAVAIVLVILRQYFLFNQDVSITLSKVSSFFVGFTLLINIGLLVDSLLSAKTNVTKDRIKVLLGGVIIASSAVGLWSMNFIFKSSLFHLDEAIMISLVFPIFMTYAIIKKNIFDIDRVIRISLTYVLSIGVVLTFYFSVIAIVGFIWPGFLRSGSLIGVLAFLSIIGAFVFKPLARNIQTIIYKLMFKSKYNRLQSLLQYGKGLSASADMDSISKLLVSDLVNLMELKGAFLITYTNDTKVAPIIQGCRGFNPAAFRLSNFRKDSSHFVGALKMLDKPQFLGDLRNVKTQKDVTYLKELGVKIAAPIESKGELLGILFLLEKESLDVFTAEDLEFLEVLCGQAAVSIENARLYIEKASKERLAAIGEVASVIIHEIKNPLGIIKVSAQTIKRKMKEEEQGWELATFIEKEADRMNVTIQQILNFAKPKENRLGYFNLDDLIRDSLHGLEISGQTEGRKFVFDLRADEKIVADPQKIRRAVLNLVMNAVQATHEGDRINVSSGFSRGGIGGFDGKTVEISVADSGDGIDEMELERIFKPFYTTKQEGTGLGLPIVNQIARDHGGIVDAKSKKSGGSEFIIRFPKISDQKLKEKLNGVSL